MCDSTKYRPNDVVSLGDIVTPGECAHVMFVEVVFLRDPSHHSVFTNKFCLSFAREFKQSQMFSIKMSVV